MSSKAYFSFRSHIALNNTVSHLYVERRALAKTALAQWIFQFKEREEKAALFVLRK